MENKKENYKIFKHAKIFNNSKLESDYYTILDFDKTCSNFQQDIILINDFLPIPEKLIKKLEKLKAFMDKKKAIVPKTSDKIAQDLINFFQDVFTKINKQIEILHTAVNYIKDRMLDMKTALMLFSDAGSMKKKKLKLEKNLKAFKEVKTTFFNKRNIIFNNLLNMDNINNDKNKENQKNIKDINDNYSGYYEKFNKTQEKVTNYCELQNSFFRKGNDLHSIIEKLKRINLISEEEKNNYIKRFFDEVEKMDHIYSMNQKRNRLTMETWENFFNTQMLKYAIEPKSKNQMELFPKVIPLFVMDKNSQDQLIEKADLLEGLHQIFTHQENSKITFEDWAKKFPQRIEILNFLNMLRTKSYSLDSNLCYQLGKYLINLRKMILNENKKDFDNFNLFNIVASTFYFQKDNKEKVYLTDIIKEADPSFKCKDILLSYMQYIYRKERLKTTSDDEGFKISQTLSSLLELINMNLEKEFVEEILEDFLKIMKIPRNVLFDEQINQHYSKKN